MPGPGEGSLPFWQSQKGQDQNERRTRDVPEIRGGELTKWQSAETGRQNEFLIDDCRFMNNYRT